MAIRTSSGRKWRTKREVRARNIKIFLAVLFILIVAFTVLIMVNHIKSVDVQGNEYYTDDEVKELIINKPFEQNALYLYWKYKYTVTDDIPFIDTVEINLKGLGNVEITIYEKGIIGMVEYLDNYMYFDKEGIIVESSKKKMDNIPQITGLSFDKFALYEKLPVKEPKVFDAILTLTQMLKKNEISPDGIHFDKNMEITLRFDEAKVLLGSDENLESKVTRLKYLMKDLEGRRGILHMENFNEETKNITFENMAE